MKKVLKTTAFMLADILAIGIAFLLGELLSRNNLNMFIEREWWLFLIAVVISVGVNASFKLYAELLRYISFIDMLFTSKSTLRN